MRKSFLHKCVNWNQGQPTHLLEFLQQSYVCLWTLGINHKHAQLIYFTDKETLNKTLMMLPWTLDAQIQKQNLPMTSITMGFLLGGVP